MEVDLRPEHEWLKQLVGEWTYEASATSPVTGEPEQMTGREQVRMLGDAWAVLESSGQTPGGMEVRNIMTLGFDPARGRFVGTFISGVMTYLWSYEGQLSEDGKTLLLDTTGPSFAPEGGTAQYQDRVEVVSADERYLASRVLGRDGQWTEFMRMRYRRVRGA